MKCRKVERARAVSRVSRSLGSPGVASGGGDNSPSERSLPGGVGASGVISASAGPFLYTFSAGMAKKSVAGFGGRLFRACIGVILPVSVPKNRRYRPVTGGKVGSGRGSDCCREWLRDREVPHPV